MAPVLEAVAFQPLPSMFQEVSNVSAPDSTTAKPCRCGGFHEKLPRKADGFSVQKGHAWKVTRTAGSKNFKTIIDEHEQQLAEAYVRHAKRGSAPLLQDARKVKAPIESDSPTLTVQPVLVGWLEAHAIPNGMSIIPNGMSTPPPQLPVDESPKQNG